MDSTKNFEYRLAWFLQLAVIPLLFLIPVYTDEIVYKYFHARSLIDGVFANTPFPQCHAPDAEMNVFVLFWPFRFIESIIFSAYFSPLWIRILSSLHVLMATGLIVYFVQKFYQKKSFVNLTYMILMVVTPMSLVFSRPEFTMFIILMMAILLSHRLYETSSPKHQNWLAVALIVTYVAILSYHHKSLFFFPLFFMILFFSPIKRATKAISILVLTGISLWAYVYVNDLLKCDASPLTAAILRKEALSPVELISNPQQGFSVLFHNLSRIGIYFRGLQFRPTYMSGWLPQVTYYHLAGEILNNLAIFYFMVFSTLILFAFGKALLNFYRGKFALDEIILLGVFIFIAVLSSIQIAKNAYEATLIVPLFLLMTFIAMQKVNISRFKYISLFRMGLLVVACSSLLVAYEGFRSPFQDWLSNENLKYQRNSFTLFYYYKHQDAARELYKECGLPEISETKHLVLDDVTYGYFYKGPRPFHILYLVGKWGEATESDLLEFLKERKSSGILSRCLELPEKYQALAIKRDDFCCIKL